ncbi:hypothetical protein J5N97_028380 [Dioscorea zingiberensis]|uniref:BHLH domain-containing protein n=1 Tax=Dioscorea zingiberensis TaxID=325984 RepID=A0A9D5H4R9_9LILI|nr:hypothetical protein J5N97_028380 [Dioscorea zingiberensis]
MNDMVPDWNMEDDSSRSFSRMLSPTNHKPELSELLWRNGHVVMQSQTNRKPVSIENESKQDQKNEEGIKWSLFQEDESGSWLQYALDDSIEKDFSSYFFCDASIADDTAEDKLAEDAATEEKNMKFGAFGDKQSTLPVQENTISEQPSLVFKSNTMLPPEPCVIDSIPKNHNSGNSGWGSVNFSQFGRPLKSVLELPHPQSGVKGSGYVDRVNAVEPSSMVSIEMSVSGSNQVQNQVDPRQNMSDNATASLPRGAKEDTLISVSHERARIDPCDTSVTSSSGGSGCSFGRMRVQSASNQSRKRKGRDVAELECHSEETEYESVEAEKQVQRSASARRSRAAEVHNLSERRRRDRINEKMRALQELIPHCNKSDKASMLDEAIEYLKALQQQVQIMWMGSGMAPMMFPGVQQYMSRFGMGIPHVPMPSIPHAIQLPGVSPLLNQSIPSGLANLVNFPNQMQNVHVPDQYAHGIAPQAMNTSTYRSQRVQLNQTAAPANPRNRRNG